MLFGKPLKPRRFEFIPTHRRKQDQPRCIQFRRICYYDAKGEARLPVKYIIFLLLILALFLYLGGPRQVMRPLEITAEDAAGTGEPTDSLRDAHNDSAFLTY